MVYDPDEEPDIEPTEVPQQATRGPAGGALMTGMLPVERWGPATVQQARDAIRIDQQLRAAAMEGTHPKNWTIFGEDPYPTNKCCLYFARVFRLQFLPPQIQTLQYTDERGPVIEFLVTQTAVFQDRTLTDLGGASTADAFFNGNETLPDGTKRVRRLPLSEVDRLKVIKTAVSRTQARVARKLLSLNFTLDEVRAAMQRTGQDPDAIPSVGFRGSAERQAKAATGRGKTSSPAKREIGQLLMDLAEGEAQVASGMLLQLSPFPGKDGKQVPGVSSIADLTDRRAEVLLHKVRELYRKERGALPGETAPAKAPDEGPERDSDELPY